MNRTTAVSIACAVMISVCMHRELGAQQHLDEFVSLDYTVFPESSLDHPQNSILPANLEIGLSAFEVFISLPSWFETRETRVFHRIAYNIRKLSYRNWDDTSGLYQPADFQGTEYMFGVSHLTSANWEILAITSPGIFSDFNGKVDWDDFKVQALLLFDRVSDRGTRYGFGATYTTMFGKELLLPVLHIRGPESSKINIELLLPEEAVLTYRLGERDDDGGSELGIRAQVRGDVYGVHGTSESPATQVDQLEYSDGTVGIHGKIRIRGPWYVAIDAGTTIHRRFSLNKEGKKINEFEIDRNMFFRIALTIKN